MRRAVTKSTRLENLRVASGISQNALHRYSGVSRQTIIRAEKREMAPSLASAFKLAKTLHTTVDWLFGDLVDDEEGKEQ